MGHRKFSVEECREIVKTLKIPTPPPEVVNYLNSIHFPIGFLDISFPVLYGQAKAYEMDNWKRPNGATMAKRVNYGAIFTHTGDAYNNIKDWESGMDSRLPAAWRLMADYHRDVYLNVCHEDDRPDMINSKETR